MAYQSLNTLKEWFRKGLKPLSQQFWDWMDSFYHKSENIPAAKVEGLGNLLDEKVSDAPKNGNPHARQDGDWVEISTGGASETSEVAVTDYVAETLAEIETPLSGALIQLKQAIKAMQEEIASLAQAALSIAASPVPYTLTTVEQTMPFIVEAASTNTDIIEANANTNTITAKAVARYQWLTSLILENTSNNTDHIVTIRTRKVSDGTPITQRTVEVKAKTTVPFPKNVTFEVAEGEAPLELYITLESTDDNDVILHSLETTLSTGGVNVSGGTALPNTWVTNATAVRALTDYTNDQDVGIYETATIYEFVNSITDADDGDNFLKPDDIDAADPGRWVKRKTFLIEESIKTDEQPVAALKYDVNRFTGESLEIDLSAGNILFSLDNGVSNKIGNSNYFKVLADGVHSVSFNTDFDASAILGITDGAILPTGSYWFYSILGNDGIHINVPKATGGLPALTAPANYVITPSGTTTLGNSWNNVLNNSGYRIYRRLLATDPWVLIATLAADITSYPDTGLIADTNYLYRIQAIGDGVSYADSPFSYAEGTTGAFPGTIFISDDFTGTTIDDSIWGTPPNTINEISVTQNDELILDSPGPTSSDSNASYLPSDASFELNATTKVLAFDVKTTQNSVQWLCGFNFDVNNRVEIIGNSGNNVYALVRNALDNSGNITTSVSAGSDLSGYVRFKIVYAAGAISFYRWNISTWTLLASTTSLITAPNMPVKFRVGYGGTPFTYNIDRVRVTDQDYSDELPD